MKNDQTKNLMNRLLDSEVSSHTRRNFLRTLGLGAAALGMNNIGCTNPTSNQQLRAVDSVDLTSIPGFEKVAVDATASEDWTPFSERKIKIGLVGHGVCKFGVAFGFQDHPNIEVVAVSDLFPERASEMAKIAKCNRIYPSLEEMLKQDKEIEAVFLATDAPNHAKHAILALERGLHVACAVPAVWGSLDDAERLYQAWKKSGKKYMMFETSAFHEDVHAMRELYKRDLLGKIIYTEGEYYHYFGTPLGGHNNWREGLIPQWYPTHSNGYYLCVTGKRFTDVSCLGVPSSIEQFNAENNIYKNNFGTEMATFKTSEDGIARMTVSWDTPGFGAEAGRIRGEKGSYYNNEFEGLVSDVPHFNRPPLPPTIQIGHHGGSHGHLTNEFVKAVIEDRAPLIDMPLALNLTVSGIVAHQSALKNGEWMKIPQFD